MSFAGLIAILSLSFGVEGWRFDSAEYAENRTGIVYKGVYPYWNNGNILMPVMIVDSRVYVLHRRHDAVFPTRNFMRRGVWKSDRNENSVFTIVESRNPWWARGIFSGGKNAKMKWPAGFSVEHDGVFKLDLLKPASNALTNSCFFNVESRYLFGYGEKVSREGLNIIQMRFDVKNRGGGELYGLFSWRKNARRPWVLLDKSLSSISPNGWRAITFSKSKSGNDYWSVTESKLKSLAATRWTTEGYIVPRNNHSSCFADSLGGWYYEACGDFSASTILEYKSVVVKQQIGQKITPWGRMTWETRGKKIGWFLPRGQHFLPRVFRTDKAPKVDDFWATPPKGMP